MPNVSATFWSCCCASRNGFSRRCDSGAVAAIERRSLLDPERDLRPARFRVQRQRRPGGERAARTRPAAAARSSGPRPVMPKLYEPGQQVAQPRHHAEELAGRRSRAGRRAGETAWICRPWSAHERTGLDAQDRRVRVGRRERRAVDRDAAEQVRRVACGRAIAHGTRSGSRARGARSIDPGDDRGVRCRGARTVTWTRRARPTREHESASGRP